MAINVGRLWNRLTGNIIGFGVGAAAASAFEPPLRDLTAQIEAQFTNRRLDPGTLAQLVATGLIDPGGAVAEARESGLDPARFTRLIQQAQTDPTVDELLELHRRGLLDDAGVERGLERNRVRPEWRTRLRSLAERLIDPGTIAGASARGLIGDDEARQLLAQHGLGPRAFELMRRTAQHPPAAGELLDLLNRGSVGEAEVTAALRNNGMRPDWISRYLELRRVLPPVSDTIRFAVREAYTPEIVQRFGLDENFPSRFAQEAARVGLAEDAARLYWRAHWELPSPTQGFQMFHRGLIDRPTLELLLRALDFMPFWRGKVIDLAYNVPGRIDLRRMFQHGVIDKPRVTRGYLDLGYRPEDAAILTEFATVEQADEERQLTKAEVVALYESRTIPREQALGLLDQLGYPEQQREWTLGLADVRRDRAYRNAVVSVVRRRHVDGEITDAEATTRLDKIGVPTAERERLLDLWQFERAENPSHVSEAQARAAWRAGIIDEGDYRLHLALLRFPANEAEWLVALHRPEAKPPEPPPDRDPTEAQLRKMVGKKLITAQQYRDYLAKRGLNRDEVELLVKLYELE